MSSNKLGNTRIVLRELAVFRPFAFRVVLNLAAIADLMDLLVYPPA
jgi:hypothetical protein